MDIKSIVNGMTLKEKIEQLTQIIYSNDNFEEIKERLKRECIGSLILATNSTAGNTTQDRMNIEQLNELQEIAVTYHKIPLLLGRDVIHGHHISLPIPLAMSAAFHPQLVKEGYECVAKEAKNDGINWAFSPMLDVSRDPRWGRIIEGAGEDPYLGERMAEAVVEGFQGKGENIFLAACAKHFVGYGASEGGRDYHRAEISEYSLRNYYLRAFHAAVKSGVATIMNSFNEVSGQPTTSSRFLLTDVLRGEMGFQGFVISDWANVERLVSHGVAKNKEQAAALALNAGLDMDMVSECYYDHLEEAVRDHLVTEETIDTAVERILYVKERLNLFEQPYCVPAPIDLEKHREYARRLEEEAIVLLKNDGHVLPLKGSEKLCVIGDMAQDKDHIVGSWELDYDPQESVSILDGIRKHDENTEYYQFHLPNARMPQRMGDSDAVIIVIGEPKGLTGEGNSIAFIEVDEAEEQMIRFARKFGKKVIGVMAYGRPRALGDVIDLFDAVLYCWHGGSQMGNAVGNILFGKCSPSGKLPVTFLRSTGQIPMFYNAPPLCLEDIYGYYDKSGRCPNYHDEYGSPLFPFGYGMSYTTFSFGDIIADTKEISLEELKGGKDFRISVTVENTGDFDAYETVQCYVRDCFSTMTRPVKELKGFEKVFLKTGEKTQITFGIGWEELGYYRNHDGYVVEKGDFKVYVGDDCMTEESVTISVL